MSCLTEEWPPQSFYMDSDKGRELERSFIANLYPSRADLVEAHRAFLERLFAVPARQAGRDRWGVKEVRWGIDEARYLKRLYPNAKFLLLHRNPFDAYRSYAARQAAGWQWYDRWPDRPLTTRRFAEHWQRLTREFVHEAASVDGHVVSYDELCDMRCLELRNYLGFEVNDVARCLHVDDCGPAPTRELTSDEQRVLDETCGGLAHSLGYRATE